MGRGIVWDYSEVAEGVNVELGAEVVQVKESGSEADDLESKAAWTLA